MPNKKNKTNDGYMNNSINDTKFQFYGNHRMLLSPPSSPMPPFRHYMPVFTSNFQSPSFQHLSPIRKYIKCSIIIIYYDCSIILCNDRILLIQNEKLVFYFENGILIKSLEVIFKNFCEVSRPFFNFSVIFHLGFSQPGLKIIR